MIGTTIATAVRILWRMLECRGIDPAPLFKEAGLDPSRRNDPLVRYPVEEATRVWVRAAEMLDDPAFGLTIANVWQPSDFHALESFAVLLHTETCIIVGGPVLS